MTLLDTPPLSQELFVTIMNHTGQVWWVHDLENDRVVQVNQFVEEITNRSREEILADPRWLIQAVHPDHRYKVAMAHNEVLAGREIELEVRLDITDKDGQAKWARARAFPLAWSGERVVLAAGIAEEITARKLAEDALAYSERTLAKAQDMARLGNWTWDIATNQVTYSRAMYRMLEVNPADLGASYDVFLDLVHPDDRTRVRQSMAETVFEEKPFDMEYRMVRPAGDEMFVHAKGEVIYDDLGEPSRVIGTVQDVTRRKKLERRLTEMALQDPLTKLFNRRYLMEQLDLEIARATRHHYPVTVCMCDLDHFKSVNDTHGHRTGDQVLVGFAEVIGKGLRHGDLAGRYGGEEFVIILPHTGPDGAFLVMERLRARLAEVAFRTDTGVEFRVTGSFGVAALAENASNSAAVLELADQAMYRAKAIGRNRVVVHRSV